MSHIHIDGKLYMRRFTLIETPWFGIRLHNICLPDQRQPLHNHPFKWFIAIVLWGGYVERRHVPGSPWVAVNMLGRLSVNRMIGQGEYHRIDYVRRNTWTLFIYGRRVDRWGFLIGGEHVDSDDFKGKGA